MTRPLRSRARDLAWTAYVWPKGRVGNALQGAVLGGLESRRVRAAWAAADRAILVHTPGKVGSRAMVAAVRPALGAGDVVFHTHRINPATLDAARLERVGIAPRRTWYTAEFLGRAVMQPGATDVVVLAAVRDPLSRNLSAFFQNVERYRPAGRPLTSPDPAQADELAELFVRRFPHEEVLGWVGSELEDLFGVDVYGAPFDHATGYQVARGDRAAVGVLRHDRLDDALPGLATELLGVRVGPPPRVNDSAGKAYGPLYRAVRERVDLGAALVERLYDSPFARHFFTEGERATARDRATTRSR